MNMLTLTTLLCTLGCGLMAGFFFAFSVVVMRSLGKLPPAQGIAAMQSINVVVINPGFLSVFLGTMGLSVFMIGASFLRWSDPRAVYWLAGAMLYIGGTFLVTMLFNVPRNNALAAVTPQNPEAAKLWAAYLSEWTLWNHVRTIAALAAALAFTLACKLR
jgi:uncharacterized membrane protein